MATLKDVSKLAGVSVTTVSRFLNGNLSLPDGTRRSILTAISALDYVPNPHARRLSLGRSDTIGLVVPDISTPFFATFVASVEEAADEKNLSVIVHASLNRPGREQAYLRRIVRHGVDGLIFMTNHTDNGSLAEIINKANRLVLVDEDIPGARVPRIFSDNETGGYKAGLLLAQNGHRHVAFLGMNDGMISSRRRFRGFQRALSEAWGGAHTITRYDCEYSVEGGHSAGRDLLSKSTPRHTAAFATSDEIVIGLLEVLQSRGLHVPDDLSIVGFDDILPLHLFAPAVSAVRQPIRDLGRKALQLLVELDWDNEEETDQEIILPVTLEERGSVGRVQ